MSSSVKVNVILDLTVAETSMEQHQSMDTYYSSGNWWNRDQQEIK